MKVINLYGGPGSGKSTTAAGVYTILKLHGVNCELVTEFAKDLTWEERKKTLNNQVYILGKQHHRLWRLDGLVDIVITDAPLLLGALYTHDDNLQNFILREYEKFDNINCFLDRVKPYNDKGRRQTEEEAREIDVRNLAMLSQMGVPYNTYPGDYKGINEISSRILNFMGIKCNFSTICDDPCESQSEEVDEFEIASMSSIERILKVRKLIIKNIGQTGLLISTITCPLCQVGTIAYSQAGNRHVHAECDNGCVSWME